MAILDVQHRYRTLGRLRMGDRQGPGGRRRLSNWRLTSPSRALLEAAAALWGGEVGEWDEAPTEGKQFELTTTVDELPVMVPPQDVESNQWLEFWQASGVKRRCDGQMDFISGRSCICQAKGDDLCKPSTHLLVMLPAIPDVGVWRLTTHGWNAAGEVPQTVKLLMTLVGAGGLLPAATLGIESRTTRGTNKAGKPETRHYTVPVLRLPFTMDQVLESTGVALTPGQHGRVPLPSEASLPADPAFEHDQDIEWGERAALPEASEVSSPAVPDGEEGASRDGVSEDVPAPEAPPAEPEATEPQEVPTTTGPEEESPPRDSTETSGSVARATVKQKQMLGMLATELEMDDDQRHRAAAVDSFNDLTKKAAATLIDVWTKQAAAKHEHEWVAAPRNGFSICNVPGCNTPARKTSELQSAQATLA